MGFISAENAEYQCIAKAKHKTMETLPNQSQMLLTLEAFAARIQGITETIPSESFDKIIDDILTLDFNNHFEFDYDDSQDVFDKFETFSIECISPGSDGYSVFLDLKVNYEVLRGAVVNDVSFSIEEMTVYDNEGDEMVLDYMQADQIKKAVESQNYKA